MTHPVVAAGFGPVDAWPVGERVRLRPPEPADEKPLALWATEAYRSHWNDFGLAPRTLTEQLADGPLISDTHGTLIVEERRTRQPVGTVSWFTVRYGPNPASRVWNLGIELIPESQGRGLGSEAQRLLVDWLFRYTEVFRIEASTDVANHAEQRALVKAGFRPDGRIRGAQYRAGQWRDLLLYGILRDEWTSPIVGPAAPS